MKIMTVNLRYINHFDKNSWNNRKYIMLNMIKKLDPDIIGFQEAMKGHLKFLVPNLENYNYYGEYRSKNIFSEMNPIFFKKDMFEIIDKNTIWLNENNKKYKIGWDASLPRVCSYIILKNNDDKFAILNTHFDHIGIKARENSSILLENIAKKLKSKYNAKILITGDFNTTPSNGYINTLLNSNIIDNSFNLFEDKNNALTIHNFTDEIKGEPIDYIFLDKDLNEKKCEIIRYSENDIKTSDHYHVLCEI